MHKKTRNKKFLLAISLMMITSGFMLSASAVSPGFYMGLMAGPATNGSGTQQVQTTSALTPTTPVSPRTNQFGTRIFMGYKVNKYAGVEGGATYFSSIHYNTKGASTYCGNPSAQAQDLDLGGKGTLPIGQSFNAYVKGGVALVYVRMLGNLNQSSATCANKYQTNIRPKMSIGASYDLSSNWVADISWNHVNVGGVVKNIDFYALGISYYFVDRFCGQFLCD